MYKYTAMFILDHILLRNLCSLIYEVVIDLVGNDPVLEDLVLLSQELPIDVSKTTYPNKEIKIDKRLAEFFLGKRIKESDCEFKIRLFIPEGQSIFLKNMLRKYEFKKDKQSAVEKLLESSFPIFSYNMEIDEKDLRFYGL